jgi:multidrug resistance efflux pump
MNKIIDLWRDKLNLPTMIILIGMVLGILHLFSYWLPITDNAFVVANNQAVAAEIPGHITQIYVKNGEHVSKGQPLFKVYDQPYLLSYQQAHANYEEAVARIAVLTSQSQKNRQILAAAKDQLAKVNYEYTIKSNPKLSHSVARLEVEQLKYQRQETKNQVAALSNQLTIDDKEILQQNKRVAALKAAMDNAKLTLDLTVVRASSSGVVDNLYLAVGMTIAAHQPLFSFVETENWYVQANFNETDLTNIRPGATAIVVLRMYNLRKIFHGVVVNSLWVTDRQLSSSKTQQQIVAPDNEWLRLPQRFPLQIKILDPDPRYPLNLVASAHVYLKA